MTIFGNVRDAKLTPHARAQVIQVSAFEVDLAAKTLRGNQPGQRFDQFRLAVTFNAGDAHDFAAAHFERDIVDSFSTVQIGY